MLGTGNATVTRCYNTCFVLKDKDNSLLLVDAGGGNGVLSQLEKANISLTDIHDVFLTHAHTDHILGVVWVARMIMQKQNNGTYQGVCRIHSHERALHVLEEICRMTSAHIFGGVSTYAKVDGEEFRQESMIADENFFTMFTFPLVAGDPETALQGMNSILTA